MFFPALSEIAPLADATMIEDRLEIFVFTYNRAPSLERTLEQFASSPFRVCRITILDNHSTDDTPAVIELLGKKLPRLRTIRHLKNIGGLANYLRAPEHSESEYTWVIADDDSYDFSDVRDILEGLEEGSSDVISVGVTGHSLPGGARASVREFALTHDFFLSHSFVPSLIFRTSLFDGDVLRAGYDNIDTMFPHFPFLIRLAESDLKLMVSRQKVITKSNNVGYSTFRFLTGWSKSCRRIQDRRLRRKAISEVFGTRIVVKNLIYCVLTERAFRPDVQWLEYKELVRQTLLLNPLISITILGFLPLIAAPDFLFRILWERYRKYRDRLGLPLPNFDETR
jgi:glycosyltransferase involved in cell wall biosynthesis